MSASKTSPALKSKPEFVRVEAWPGLLAGYLELHRSTGFEFGRFDCCLFAADWVKLCTGQDPAKGLRGYKSEPGALKLLKEHGGVRGLADGVFPRVKLAFARRGDLVAYREPSLKGPAWACNALGILEGRYGWFATRDGLRPVPRESLLKTAWKVGGA